MLTRGFRDIDELDFPADWQVLSLADACENMKQGKILPQSDISSAGSFPVYGANGRIGYCKDYFLDCERVLITCRGSTCGFINKTPPRSFVTNNAMILYQKDFVDTDFLSFVLQEFSTVSLKVGSGQPQLTKGILNGHRMPVPSLAEQRKIAGVLGLVQRALEQQERLIALTTELKKALLHQLFTQGLRGEPQKQTDIGPVPESWEVVPLGSLAKVGNGSTPKRDNEGYWQGGTIPWLNSAKIHERFIIKADQFVTDLAVKECHLPRVKPGSLLVAITGQGKTLGNTALVSFETCINQHLAYAQFTTTRVIPEFVLWFMQTRYDHLRSISQAGGSTKGALTCGYLKTYPVPLPSLNEQREIADVFFSLDRKEKVTHRKHAALTALFRTLLHQLMTAQIRVHDVDFSDLGVDYETREREVSEPMTQ